MYLNEAQISLTGYVATQPQIRTTPSGALNVSMRVAWTPRRQDRITGEWADGNTSYVTVICWRKLASNAGVCLRKGDPVVVKGRLSIREFDDKQGMRRTAVEVEATSVGHDLSRGVAQFQRVRPQTGMTAAEFAAAEARGGTGIPGDGGAAANGLAMANGLAAANGLASINGSGSQIGASDDADAASRALLDLTETGFSASPGSMGADLEPSPEQSARNDADEAVDRLLDEGLETEQSRELEPVGAPF
jgi:single-strand DNA-binding protein